MQTWFGLTRRCAGIFYVAHVHMRCSRIQCVFPLLSFERLKTEYLAAKEANPNDPIFNRFQMEYESNIFAFVDECDRRIRVGSCQS